MNDNNVRQKLALRGPDTDQCAQWTVSAVSVDEPPPHSATRDYEPRHRACRDVRRQNINPVLEATRLVVDVRIQMRGNHPDISD